MDTYADVDTGTHVDEHTYMYVNTDTHAYTLRGISMEDAHACACTHMLTNSTTKQCCPGMVRLSSGVGEDKDTGILSLYWQSRQRGIVIALPHFPKHNINSSITKM